MDILIENINKQYNGKKIISNLTLNIKQGESIAILGNSGSGKSTLLKTIGLLTPPDSGYIYYNNIKYYNVKSSKKIKLYRENIGFIFQDFGLIEDITVYENLKNSLFYKKKTKIEQEHMIQSILKKFNLEDKKKASVNTLSGGEKQRVALMKIILKNPDIILADEPTGSLDKSNSDFVIQELLNLNSQNKTLILVTHDLDFANKMKTIINI